MSLRLVGHVDLPDHLGPGGFDHAAVHRRSGRLYAANTANNALDVIDCATDQYLRAIGDLAGVAGALVSDERDLVFTSNRGENTVAIFAVGDESALRKVPVGIRPNGLSFDPKRNLLLAAHVGDPAIPGSTSVWLIDVAARSPIAAVPVPGRTRWTVFDAQTGCFYVNIAAPAQMVVIAASEPTRVAHTLEIPAAGPHGLDLDTATRRLFCACDSQQLVVLDMATGRALQQVELSGAPDVVFFNAALRHLYVAIGDPGVIDVFDTDTIRRIEVVNTERGAHTIAFDAERNKVYAFLPQTYRAAVYRDEA